jgi:hypothetical protein
MATLPTLFKQIYGKALTPLGFQKLKGRHPYFVRMIGDEILHVISFVNDNRTMIFNGNYGEVIGSAFVIYGGIATVYRQEIDFTILPKWNTLWLRSVPNHYINPKCMYNDKYNAYNREDSESIISAVNLSLEKVKNLLFPTINEIITLKKCVKYFYDINTAMVNYYIKNDLKTFGNEYQNIHNEWLLPIKVLTCDEFIEIREHYIELNLMKTAQDIKDGNSGYSKEDFDEKVKKSNEEKPIRIAKAKKMYADKEWCDSVLVELERRKKENIERLKSYNLIKE